ncbi:Radical SAM superfamily protein [Pseudobutyrivibrio sp. ACV-2]|uniref:radical SAM protein n=1 Tax=Pseudobutyrivibrio sp. ACV-2 TaxID=1520801 RepID=UPI00089BEE24|nr:radical SAM protein [Pseudobutyrivibrio sp. ACV-2]SEA97077.1 Radical SAM superfamily protein [Pseudobutyrivibrio sp. ACV-2]
MARIDYLEFWATKHCNLNCKGCSSCSPIQEKWNIDIEVLKQDLNRLKALKILIDNINILGGEPLLHPHIADILNAVKHIFPNCNLGLLTNGLLIKNMDNDFWNSCVENNVILKITCFPVFSEDDIEQIVHLLEMNGIKYQLTRKIRFNKILIENNPSKMEDILLACGCNHAYNLYGGYVSRCTVPMITEKFNSKFGTNLNTEGKLNIYDATAEEIIDFLMTPNNSCLNCSAFPQKVAWSQAGEYPSKDDWLIG